MKTGIMLYAKKLFKNKRLPLNKLVSVKFGNQMYDIAYINQKVKDSDFNEIYVVHRIQISTKYSIGFGVLFKEDTWLDNRLHCSIKL